MFFVFEAEALNNKNYEISYFGRWNLCVVVVFLFVLYLIIFVLVYPIYSKFWLCDYC